MGDLRHGEFYQTIQNGGEEVNLSYAINRAADPQAAIAQVAAALRDPTIRVTTLNIGDNQIGDEGATQIASALNVNTTLQNLILDENQIGDNGAT